MKHPEHLTEVEKGLLKSSKTTLLNPSFKTYCLLLTSLDFQYSF